MIELFWQHTLASFALLFMIVDPFLGLASFMPITSGMSKKDKVREATIAVVVAFCLLIGFMFFGKVVLDYLRIDLSSFVVAGGILLLFLGVQTVMGKEFLRKNKELKERKSAAILIGTPILCGPGAMTTIVILYGEYGYLPPLLASIAVILLTWFILCNADRIEGMLGKRIIQIFSRVMGFILVAIAVNYMKNGILMMIRDFRIV